MEDERDAWRRFFGDTLDLREDVATDAEAAGAGEEEVDD